MGWGFRKSKKIGGFRLSIGRRGASVSAGVPGFRHSISTSGRRRTTATIPGTGISYSHHHGRGRRASYARAGLFSQLICTLGIVGLIFVVMAGIVGALAGR